MAVLRRAASSRKFTSALWLFVGISVVVVAVVVDGEGPFEFRHCCLDLKRLAVASFGTRNNADMLLWLLQKLCCRP